MNLSDYSRRGHAAPREIPADEQARYEAALEAFRVLEAYEHTEWGGPDYCAEVPPPPKVGWVWDETEEEHRERIKGFPKTITIPVFNTHYN